MSQVIGSAKFHSLEVVDSAKFSNEIVFEDLTMDGEDLTIALSGVFTLTSLATDTTSPAVDFVGISMTAVEEVQIQSTSSQASILGGDEVTGANAAVTTGSVVLGYTLNAVVTPAVEVVLPATGTANVAIGFFNTTPVVQQTSPALPTDLTTSQAAINTIVAIMESYGLSV
jgi:hypothetical protein